MLIFRMYRIIRGIADIRKSSFVDAAHLFAKSIHNIFFIHSAAESDHIIFHFQIHHRNPLLAFRKLHHNRSRLNRLSEYIFPDHVLSLLK